MKKKYFVTSDIHSFYTEFITALTKAGYEKDNANHILVICGDAFDRGNESKKLLDFLLELPDDRLIYIRGNHEDLLDKIVNSGLITTSDIRNGTVKTIADIIGCEECDVFTKSSFLKNILENKNYYTLISKTVDYAEIGNYIFVHGWIPSIELEAGKLLYYPEWRYAHSSEWSIARWDNGMAAYFQGVKEPGKTIVCGHWHASYGNIRKNNYIPKSVEEELDETKPELFEPFEAEGIIALDACTALTHKVNIKVLEIDDNNSKN